jgi:hypothetical protein
MSNPAPLSRSSSVDSTASRHQTQVSGTAQASDNSAPLLPRVASQLGGRVNGAEPDLVPGPRSSDGLELPQQLNRIFANNKDQWPDTLIEHLKTETGLQEAELSGALDSLANSAGDADSDASSVYFDAPENMTADDMESTDPLLDRLSGINKELTNQRIAVLTDLKKHNESVKQANEIRVLQNSVRKFSSNATSDTVARAVSAWMAAVDTPPSAPEIKVDKNCLMRLKADFEALDTQGPGGDGLNAKLFQVQENMNFLDEFLELSNAGESRPLLDLNVMGGRVEINATGEIKTPSLTGGGATFLDVLKGSSVGSGNHGLERAGWIRSEMNGLLDKLDSNKTAKISRNDVTKIAVALDNKNPDKTKEVLALFESNENYGGHNLGSYNINRIAAMNLVAAGYNTKTLERDAPSLEYKTSKVGFSGLTKVMYAASRAGKITREPGKHVQPRLDALAGMQQLLEAKLYPPKQPVEVRHLLTSNLALTEFGALMIAAMPKDFLILNPGFVKEIESLTTKCKNEAAGFEHFVANKEAFVNIHKNLSDALDKHRQKEKAEVTALVEISDQLVVDVHRRGAIKKAVSSIARSFMLNIGAPLGGLKRAMGEFLNASSASMRFKGAMADSRAKHPVPGLLHALKTTENLVDEQKSTLEKFLCGKSDQLDLSQIDKDCFTTDQWRAFKAHVDEKWRAVAPKLSLPRDLVKYPNGLPLEFYLLPGVVPAQAETKAESKAMTRALASGEQSTGHADSAMTVKIEEINRSLNRISGDKNRCWLRAANAAALGYAGVDEVSRRVFEELQALEGKWKELTIEGETATAIPVDYKPFWPQKITDVTELYAALGAAHDKRFVLNDDQEERLQKLTLQLAYSTLQPELLSISENRRAGDSQTEGNRLLANFSNLFEMKHVQGDVQIINAFLGNKLGIGHGVIRARPAQNGLKDVRVQKNMPHTTVQPMKALKLDASGQPGNMPLIVHSGDVNSGHFSYSLITQPQQ